MTTDTPTKTPFDLVLESWPGGHLIGDRWRNEERNLIIIESDDGHWIIEAVAETFSSKQVGNGRMTVIVAPALAASMCAWHAEEYGPYVTTDAVAAFGELDDLDDDAFVAAIATYAEQRSNLDAGELLDEAGAELSDIYRVAVEHGFTLDAALTLAGDTLEPDDLDAVLAAATAPQQ